jgi:hypothetical protein
MGRGHAVTTALSNRVAGAALKKAAARRQAQVNVALCLLRKIEGL